MTKITRRGFLTMAGTGVAGVAVAKVGMGFEGFGSKASGGAVQFVAVGPLPPAKVSPIATMVLRGHASPGGSGQITTQVYPGNPATSDQALPKMTRVGRVEGVRTGTPLRLTGRVDNVANPAFPHTGEFEIFIHPERKWVLARIQGVEYQLELTEFRAA